MFNSPYMNGFNGFREPNQQQPIQNIFTSQVPTQDYFMARFIKDNEKPEEMFVNHKTAFISLKNKSLIIKDTNGELTTYGLILPRDEKDDKIDALERQVQELKEMISNEQIGNDPTSIPADNEITEPKGNIKKSIRK